MSINKKIWVECEDCGINKNLTIHHIKNIYGVKTGEIKSVCRDCHDIEEYEYRKSGRLGKKMKDSIPTLATKGNEKN